MVACQAAGADSVVRAIRRNAQHVVELERVDTAALSIAEVVTGDHAARAVYESGGDAVSVTDAELFAAAAIAGRQGLSIESSSAASLAGAKACEQTSEDEIWVAIATGASIKWPHELLTREFGDSDEVIRELLGEASVGNT
jgi:threonine synthase